MNDLFPNMPKTTYENETTKMQRIVLSFGNGNYSKPFCTNNAEKAKRIHNAKEYFEVK